MDKPKRTNTGQSDVTATISTACIKFHFLASAREHLNALSALLSSSDHEMNTEEAFKIRTAIEDINDTIAPYNNKLWK